MKKRFKNILIKTRKKNGFSLLVCVVSITLVLGTLVGCSITEPDSNEPLATTNKSIPNETNNDLPSIPPETKQADTKEPNSTVSKEETLSADGQQIKGIVEEFAVAYFSGDKESIQNYLATPYEWDIDIYGGAADTVSNMSIKGLTEIGENDTGNVCVVSLEYKSNPESDMFQYLTIELIKQSNGWKIQFYGIEG